MEDEKTLPLTPEFPDTEAPAEPDSAPDDMDSPEAAETAPVTGPETAEPAPIPEPPAEDEPGPVPLPDNGTDSLRTADTAPDPEVSKTLETREDPASAAPEAIPLEERLNRLEALVAAYEAQRKQQEEDRQLRSHFDGLYRQGEQLKTALPDFDLGRELENPLFARLTAPGTGLTVLQAWACAHAEELAAPKAPAPDNSPRTRSDNRPAESGLNAQGASLSSFDYRQLSREQRENIKTAVRNARATGEKLYPPGT